jgi:membrane dipeptidase
LAPRRLAFRDRRADAAGWAKELGISREAIDIYLAGDVIDLHLDTFIWQRSIGWDLRTRHGKGPLFGRVFGQVDLPRAREAAMTGGMWVITTNPLRRAAGRARAFTRNVRALKDTLDSVGDDVMVCRSLAEYQQARAADKHAAFLAIQGGNALDRDAQALDLIPDDLILRITLVHLYNSSLGETSAPSLSKRGTGLTAAGKAYVKRMNEKRILVDLAHIDKAGFFDAADVHDKSQPLIVTHTGIEGVHNHWRNIDDRQIKVIADTGGTIGIMYQRSFLGRSATAASVVDHMQRVVDVAGDDFISLGSDFDGAILPPPDLATCLEVPRLVQVMLDRGWQTERIHKALGKNFLRVLGAIRPTRPSESST